MLWCDGHGACFGPSWRQQFLILALITVAVAATIVGSTVAMNNSAAQECRLRNGAVFRPLSAAYNSQAASVITRLEHVGPVEVIENQTLSILGSIDTYQLRAQVAPGPFAGPMLSLLSGHYPSAPDQVAVTSGVALAFHLTIGKSWQVGGVARDVVGIVENPQSLLDAFAFVVPGQVVDPTGVTVLFEVPGAPLTAFKGAQIETPASVAAVESVESRDDLTRGPGLGMLLIALVSIGGFTVLVQRRMRSIGMLESTGATDRHVRLVVSANGAVVGIAVRSSA